MRRRSFALFLTSVFFIAAGCQKPVAEANRNVADEVIAREKASFEAWMNSPAFGHGHRDASERAGGEAKPPVSVASEVWAYKPAGGSTPAAD